MRVRRQPGAGNHRSRAQTLICFISLAPKLLLSSGMQCRFAFAVILGVTAAVCPGATPTEYTTDGAPTGLEEEIRWRVNRGRFDSASENQTRGTAYADVPASTGPLAPHQSITLAARHHSEDMAKKNVMQHATVPGSAYYDPTNQPDPWDRMEAEGYSWNNAGENIAAGYSGAEAVYVGWWKSTGHRQNMYNSSLREIGNGYYYWSSSTYKHYYTMDLGSSGASCFFTDTLFRDANTNGLYDQGEGSAGVAVTLLVGGSLHGYLDLSSTVGSFAIPIQSIAAAATVQVVLSNRSAATITLSVPRDYRAYTSVVLAPGEGRVFGTFSKPASVRNIGLRDVSPLLSAIVPARLAITRSGTNILLAWPSEIGLQYLPQRTTNFLAWSNVTTGYQTGTGSNMSCSDPLAASGSRKFYRLLIQRP
jgi:hypothetical protein